MTTPNRHLFYQKEKEKLKLLYQHIPHIITPFPFLPYKNDMKNFHRFINSPFRFKGMNEILQKRLHYICLQGSQREQKADKFFCLDIQKKKEFRLKISQ